VNIEEKDFKHMPTSPNLQTASSDDNSQALFMQAMLSQMKPEQAAPIQAALAAQAKRMANRRYLRDSIRKLSMTLTNGVATQTYAINTPFTFNMSTTALNAYTEGIVVRVVLNYTLAVGTSAVYGLTAAGKFAIIDTIELRYNKSQIKIRPKYLRDLALMGALDVATLPDAVLVGQQDTTVQNWLNTTMPVTTGANSVSLEFFLPFNLLEPQDPRGILPFMAGDTGLQCIINTPVSLLGTSTTVAHPLLNAIYPVSGSGHAISSIGGTISVETVYRDGDWYGGIDKLPFDISAVEGTLQQQIDQLLNPLIAGSAQRTKVNIMGKHQYILLTVIDGVQPNAYALTTNIAYIESSKDGNGGNTFWKYGSSTNLDVREFFALKRWVFGQDLDEGVVPMVHAPLAHHGTMGNLNARTGKNGLDNTRTGWADWRYAVQVTATGSFCAPIIEPYVAYVNPVGLVPV